MTRPLVIGVGNPYRRDDGVGLEVLAVLAARQPGGLEIAEEAGEPAALIARWSDRDHVVLVDAVTSATAVPGTVHRLECCDGRWQVPPPAGQASTHGLGVADAVELGRILDQLPRRIVLFGVETQDTGSGVGLTPGVAAAVPGVVAAVLAEVGAERPGGVR